MRKKKLAKNTIASLVYQITTVFCGFVLPRYILQYFGSEVNGLVNSIEQFLAIITFFELGIGAVVQSSLYKPLAEKDNAQISRILTSAGKFFSKLARILLIYVIALIVVYPYISKKDFGGMYTAMLIAAISISYFAQYYFGMVDMLLLTADQKGYIQYNIKTITLLINTMFCVGLIKIGASIHAVKLTTSVVFLARPFFLRRYVNKNYYVDRNIHYQGEPIKQKWNGVAQHVAAVVLDSTDTIVLTLFSSLASVSIYAVYFLVVNGIKKLLLSMTNGIHALIGELWAKQELDDLKSLFGWTEWTIHTITTFVFGCTGVLLIPFVRVYTLGITDAQYIQPLFAALLTAAHAGHCLRLPYNIMILSAGHYKQTQNNYIVAAVMNVVISVLSVKLFGLIGVAVGTLVSMMYQTIWMALYTSKNLIKWPFSSFLKQITIDIITVVLATCASRILVLHSETYGALFELALGVAIIWILILLIVNMVFYRAKITFLLKSLKVFLVHW